MMISVAAASALWAGHDFVLPHLGAQHNDIAALAAAAQTQLAGFRDWKVRTLPLPHAPPSSYQLKRVGPYLSFFCLFFGRWWRQWCGRAW